MSSQRKVKQNTRVWSSEHRSSAISDACRAYELKNPPPPPRPLTEEELSVLAQGEEQYKKRKEYVVAERAKQTGKTRYGSDMTDWDKEEQETFILRRAFRLFPNYMGTLPRGFNLDWLGV